MIVLICLYSAIAFISVHIVFAGIAWARAPSWTKAKTRDSSGRTIYEIVGRMDQKQEAPRDLWDSIRNCFDVVTQVTHKFNNPTEEAGHVLWPRMLFSYIIVVLHRTLLATRLSDDSLDRIMAANGNNDKVHPVDRTELEGLLERAKFANWAYPFHKDYQNLEECLRREGFLLIQHDPITSPGKVAHYIAIHQTQKRLLIVPRGSCGLSDLLTDAAGNTMGQDLTTTATTTHKNDTPVIKGLEKIWSHEGCLTAANQLSKDCIELVQRLVTREGYNLEIVGHSLGAAVATLMGAIFLNKIPALQNPNKFHIWAYAPPPCLNQEASDAIDPYISTIVWNDDVVPTLSVDNYVFTCRILAHMNEQEQAYRGKKLALFGALVAAATTTLGFRKAPMAISDDRLDEMVHYALEYTESLHSERQNDNDSSNGKTVPQIHVPGQVIYLWERRHWNMPTGEINAVKAQGSTFLHLHLVIPTKDSLPNHFMDSYERGMQQLLQQMGDETEHRRSIFLWEQIPKSVLES
ncbi:Lipase (class 3) [Seminavis robusta]|uniref:sn-1-specific diacylglycerol lipase n=1 Tax=Seminavis robusta TaxID=568900 RepID=A0A9N8E4X4_9STRA|nr:Lipase (class 3) [Seminavis robusta]|eukprot:Sro505_g156080.1 Lipase (class 3) (520) ;mRNA; r:5697-7256